LQETEGVPVACGHDRRCEISGCGYPRLSGTRIFVYRARAWSEAVIDKDRTSSLLACQLGADMLLLTDVDVLYLDFCIPQARRIKSASAGTLAAEQFASGSMRPKNRSGNTLCHGNWPHGRYRPPGRMPLLSSEAMRERELPPPRRRSRCVDRTGGAPQVE